MSVSTSSSNDFTSFLCLLQRALFQQRYGAEYVVQLTAREIALRT
jgi:hypothetical protein